MAHNDYLRPGGNWVDLDVPTGDEFTEFDQRQYLSIHEGGGTWAITSNVVIGAAAAQTWRFTLPLTSDSLNATVASGKTLSIASGGSLRVDSGGSLRVDSGATFSVLTASASWGNGSVLDMLSGSTLKIESGALFDILSGGVGDIESGGMFRAKSGGLIRVLNGGTLECQASSTFTLNGTTTLGAVFTVGSGGQIVVSSGRDLTVAAGATFTMSGTMTCAAGSAINASGTCNIKTGGAFTINSGATFTCLTQFYVRGGTGILQIGSLIGGSGELVIESNSTLTQRGTIVRAGASANTSLRIAASSTVNATFDPSTKDIWEIPNVLGSVTYTLDDPADTTCLSEHVFTRDRHKNPVGGITISRTTAPATIATFNAAGSGGGSVVVYWDGSVWAARSGTGNTTT